MMDREFILIPVNQAFDILPVFPNDQKSRDKRDDNNKNIARKAEPRDKRVTRTRPDGPQRNITGQNRQD